MSQVTEQSVRFQTALASIKLIQASAVLDLTEDDFDFLTSNKVWIATDRSRARRCVEACVYGTLDFVGYPRFAAPDEFIAAVIAYYVHPVNIQTPCLIMEGAELTENIITGVERPVKAAELFAFTLRVRAGNTDVLTDAEENVRQKLRAEGVMECLKVKNVLALALVVRSRCEVLKASVKALVFGMKVVNNFNCRGFGPLLEDKLCLIFKLAPSVCRMTFPLLASLLVRLVVLLPFQLFRLSLATPSRWTPLPLSVFLHCVVALLLTLLPTFLLFMSLIVTFMVNSGLSSGRMVLMPVLSRLLTLLVILTMPLFLARLTLIPIKYLSICFRVILISITTILKRRGCLTVPRLTLMSLIKMMLVMVSVAAISKTFGLRRFLLRLSFLAKCRLLPHLLTLWVCKLLMLICILTKNVITSCSVTMMLFLHLEVKPLMTLTTVL